MLLLGFSRFGGRNKEIKYNRRKGSAFTLAEVLITLGIIGVVAAMTLPTLVQKYEEKATVTALKKFYSVIQQAYQFAVAEHGTPDEWGLSAEDSGKMLTYIVPHMKIIKICTIGDKCHSKSTLYTKAGGSMSNSTFNPTNKVRYSAKLADGMIIATYTFPDDSYKVLGKGKHLENVYGEYMVDINGDKKPNQYGRDIFIFNLTKYGVVPNGTSDYTSKRYTFNEGCLSKTAEGFGCTAWVIYNENMDYLHCDDLSWDGKHKCN